MQNKTPPNFVPRRWTLVCLRCWRLNLHNCDILRIILEEIYTGTPLSLRTRFCNNCRAENCGECTCNAASAENDLQLMTEESVSMSSPELAHELPIRQAMKRQRHLDGKPALPSLFPHTDEFPNYPDRTPLDPDATHTHQGKPLTPLPNRGVGGGGHRGRGSRWGQYNYRGDYNGYGFGGGYPPYHPYQNPPYGQPPYAFGGQYGGPHRPVPPNFGFNPAMGAGQDAQTKAEVARLNQTITRMQAEQDEMKRAAYADAQRTAKRSRTNNSEEAPIGRQALQRADKVGANTDRLAMDLAQSQVETSEAAEQHDQMKTRLNRTRANMGRIASDLGAVQEEGRRVNRVATNLSMALANVQDHVEGTSDEVNSMESRLESLFDEIERLKSERMANTPGHFDFHESDDDTPRHTRAYEPLRGQGGRNRRWGEEYGGGGAGKKRKQ